MNLKKIDPNRKKLDASMMNITKILHDIYKNKSSDEYKMMGDITKSSSYDKIEKSVADLSVLKGFPKSDASDLNQVFNALHRPFFKNMVKAYVSEPNEKNTVFCALFTLGYRMLVGELSRIFASTEATQTGIVYKPNKVSRKNDISKVIALYKGDMEAKINAAIRASHASSNTVNEAMIETVIEQLYVEEYLDEKFDDIYDESVQAEKRKSREAIFDILHGPVVMESTSDDGDDVEPVEESSDLQKELERIREFKAKHPGIKQRPPMDNETRTREMLADIQDFKAKHPGVRPVEEGHFGELTGRRGLERIKTDENVDRKRDGKPAKDNGILPVDMKTIRNMSREQLMAQAGFLDEGDISTAVDPSYGSAPTGADTPVDTSDDGSTVDTTSECGQCNSYTATPKSIQEGVTDRLLRTSDKLNDFADKIGPKLGNIAAWVAPISTGIGILAGLLGRVTSFASGRNPIAEINFFFTDSYDKKIKKLDDVTDLYLSTKEAYDQYMRLPSEKRNRQIIDKYKQNMEKYNIKMQNLAAEIEHYNSRAKQEADDADDDVEEKIPSTTSTPSKPETDKKPPQQDDDFQF